MSLLFQSEVKKKIENHNILHGFQTIFQIKLISFKKLYPMIPIMTHDAIYNFKVDPESATNQFFH